MSGRGMRSSGRVVEGARLESVYTVTPYRGFESLLLRHFPFPGVLTPYLFDCNRLHLAVTGVLCVVSQCHLMPEAGGGHFGGTRSAMWGMLTDAAARKAKAREKDYKLADSGGSDLFITRTGHRSWRLKYRFGGKERRIVLGPYPEVPLAQARIMRVDAKRLLREGRDPRCEAKLAKMANTQRHEHTFEGIAREWHALQKER